MFCWCSEPHCSFRTQDSTNVDEAVVSLQHHVCSHHPVDSIINVHVRCAAGRTALHRAARYGMKERCLQLLMRGAGVDDKTVFNNTPLMLAAEKGFTDVCDLLLDHGANISLKDAGGFSAFDCARNHGHLNTCYQLVSRGADGHNMLMRALSDFDFEVAHRLLEHGADAKVVEARRNFAVIVAVRHLSKLDL